MIIDQTGVSIHGFFKTKAKMGCVQVQHLIVLINVIIRFECTTTCLSRVAWDSSLPGACDRREPQATVPRLPGLLCRIVSTLPLELFVPKESFT